MVFHSVGKFVASPAKVRLGCNFLRVTSTRLPYWSTSVNYS